MRKDSEAMDLIESLREAQAIINQFDRTAEQIEAEYEQKIKQAIQDLQNEQKARLVAARQDANTTLGALLPDKLQKALLADRMIMILPDFSCHVHPKPENDGEDCDIPYADPIEDVATGEQEATAPEEPIVLAPVPVEPIAEADAPETALEAPVEVPAEPPAPVRVAVESVVEQPVDVAPEPAAPEAPVPVAVETAPAEAITERTEDTPAGGKFDVALFEKAIAGMTMRVAFAPLGIDTNNIYLWRKGKQPGREVLEKIRQHYPESFTAPEVSSPAVVAPEPIAVTPPEPAATPDVPLTEEVKGSFAYAYYYERIRRHCQQYGQDMPQIAGQLRVEIGDLAGYLTGRHVPPQWVIDGMNKLLGMVEGAPPTDAPTAPTNAFDPEIDDRYIRAVQEGKRFFVGGRFDVHYDPKTGSFLEVKAYTEPFHRVFVARYERQGGCNNEDPAAERWHRTKYNQSGIHNIAVQGGAPC